jgi:hypothetical protein
MKRPTETESPTVTTYRAVLAVPRVAGDEATVTEEAVTLEDRTPGQVLDAFLDRINAQAPDYTAFQRLTFTLDAT